jgi:hypothetical protein
VTLLVSYPDLPPSIVAATPFRIAHAQHTGATVALCNMPVFRGESTWPPTEGPRCPDCVRLAAED